MREMDGLGSERGFAAQDWELRSAATGSCWKGCGMERMSKEEDSVWTGEKKKTEEELETGKRILGDCRCV